MIRTLASLPVLAVALAGCVGEEEKSSTPVQTECAVTRVYDGDTLGLLCGGGPAELVRLAGLDAPEIARANCADERAKGVKARAALERLVASGPVTDRRIMGRHPDGRRLVELDIGGRDLGRAMVETGLALPTPNAEYRDWCAG